MVHKKNTLPKLAAAALAVCALTVLPAGRGIAASSCDNLAAADVNGAMNLRAEPSTDGKVLGVCYRGAGGEILDRKNGWTKVRSGSLEGWMKDDYLVSGDKLEKMSRELGLYMAQVQTDGLRVRAEAGAEADILDFAHKGELYPALSETDGWVKIQLTAEENGYVSADYVSFRVVPGKAVSIEAEEAAVKAAESAKAEKKKGGEKNASGKKNEGGKKSGGGTGSESASAAGSDSYAISVSSEEIYLMAACLEMETGDSSYEGELAVGSVIVNRVRSGMWGSTVSDVIYAAGQFPGATSGLLDQFLSKGPSATAVKAAKDALAGKNNIGDYLYFKAARTADTSQYSSYVILDGNCFYKK